METQKSKSILDLFDNKEIIVDYYYNNLTFKEIGDKNGYSKQMAWQVIKKEINKAEKEKCLDINKFNQYINKIGGSTQERIADFLNIDVGTVKLYADLCGLDRFNKFILRNRSILHIVKRVEKYLRTVDPIENIVDVTPLSHIEQTYLSDNIVLHDGKWTSKLNKKVFKRTQEHRLVSILKSAKEPIHYTEFAPEIKPSCAINILSSNKLCQRVGQGTYIYSKEDIGGNATDMVRDYVKNKRVTVREVIQHLSDKTNIKPASIKQYVYDLCERQNDGKYTLIGDNNE